MTQWVTDPKTLMPVDVQMRADAELGAAWRRAEAACPKGWRHGLEPLAKGRTLAYAGPWGSGTFWADLQVEGDTPAAALDALTEALANR